MFGKAISIFGKKALTPSLKLSAPKASSGGIASKLAPKYTNTVKSTTSIIR